MSLRVLSFFVRYGDSDYKGAYQALMEFYARLPRVDVSSVLIDTALPAGVEAHLGRCARMMAGDNRRREFSGWNSALEKYAGRLDEFDLIHLVTSAFRNEYNGFYPLVRREMFEYAAEHPDVVMAHVDAYPDTVRMFGRTFQTWACSKFLLASPGTIRGLESFTGPFGARDFFADRPDGLFIENGPLSENYRKYLVDWLTGDGLPHGKWHSVFELTPENVERFHAKALSILDEHSFSMRLREIGAKIIDFTWWHANRLKGALPPPPEEIFQVIERNRFLFDAELVEARDVLRECPAKANPAIDRILRREGNAPFGRSQLMEALAAGMKGASDRMLDDPVQCAALYFRLPETLYAEGNNTLDESQWAWLAVAFDGVEQDVALPITRGLYALWQARDDLRGVLDLREKSGREGLLGWWMRAGRYELANVGLMPEAVYGEISPGVEQDVALPITRGLYALWQARDDLRGAFDIRQPAGRQKLSEWAAVYGKDEADFVLWLPDKGEMQVSGKYAGKFLEKGVNVIGYSRGEFGIGEDVRMATRALATTDLYHCVPKVGLKAASAQRDDTVRGYETKWPLYNVNLICLPHYETLRLLQASRHEILDRRYNISFGQWELSRFPEKLRIVLDVVDEIWTISSFSASAMRAATDKPVFPMPLAVELPPVAQEYSRGDFGLAEGDFIFLTVFDGLSSIARKNPQAVIRAFKKAFPCEKGVGLVVKAMNVNTKTPAWTEMIDSAKGDARISFIVENMPRGKLIALQQACDCFVSLHRAEGFGRNIAEAMLLGKPVIVSNYSGNRDFTTDETAFLVNGAETKVRRGDYPFHERQVWFDPDVSMASEQMIRCVQDSGSRIAKSAAGAKTIRELYSPETVGKNYVKRLSEIAFH
jgi:glycosyltransferase involved in cell wall biosynthesis